MDLNSLTAVSPIDGRYRDKIAELGAYFSEYALMKYRVKVEIEYFIALTEIPLGPFKFYDTKTNEVLRNIYKNFTPEDAQLIKNHEKKTNHDVKAVEYFLRDKFDAAGLSSLKEFIHFGLTSQDINNTAVPMSLKDAMENIYYPLLDEILKSLDTRAAEWDNIAMLARTHGQPASPTRLGKEINVFTERIRKQIQLLKAVPHCGKFGGATGNFNAHFVAYPEVDWNTFANNLLNKKLGLVRSYPTTQIEHYDNLAALFDGIKRINTILIDFSRDMWTYISMEYFKQKINKDEVGSSAMPHKVNPIDFENAEGNFGMANAMFEHLSAKLPISRLQRDLTDSTVIRNIGVPIAHTLIGFKSLIKGWGKIQINEPAIKYDLEKNYVVIAEAVQTILRSINYPNAYEKLKEFTRTTGTFTRQDFEKFIDSLEVDKQVKERLKLITPFNYTGK
jgi:adenylosuccinate lyase